MDRVSKTKIAFDKKINDGYVIMLMYYDGAPNYIWRPFNSVRFTHYDMI